MGFCSWRQCGLKSRCPAQTQPSSMAHRREAHGAAFGLVLVPTPAANSVFWLHFSSTLTTSDGLCLPFLCAFTICGQLIKWKNPGKKSSCPWSDGWVGSMLEEEALGLLSIHMKGWVWWCPFAILVSGDWRWVIPGGSWPASPAWWVSSRSMRDLVSKEIDSVHADDTGGCPLAPTCIHTYKHSHRHAHKKVLITCCSEHCNKNLTLPLGILPGLCIFFGGGF